MHGCCKDTPGRPPTAAPIIVIVLSQVMICCRGSGDEATSIMELYVRAVMSSDEFDKDFFDMEHMIFLTKKEPETRRPSRTILSNQT